MVCVMVWHELFILCTSETADVRAITRTPEEDSWFRCSFESSRFPFFWRVDVPCVLMLTSERASFHLRLGAEYGQAGVRDILGCENRARVCLNCVCI